MPVCEQLATDQFDPSQPVVPRQDLVLTPYSRLLISTAFVVVSGVGCLRVTGVETLSAHHLQFFMHFTCFATSSTKI